MNTHCIAILPTGEWAEITQINQIEFVFITEEQLNMMADLSNSSILELASGLTEDGVNAVFKKYVDNF